MAISPLCGFSYADLGVKFQRSYGAAGYDTLKRRFARQLNLSDVEVDSISIALDNVGNNIAGSVSQTVPVVVKFTALSGKLTNWSNGENKEILLLNGSSEFHTGDSIYARTSISNDGSFNLDEILEKMKAEKAVAPDSTWETISFFRAKPSKECPSGYTVGDVAL